ncbi:hypothetical protein CAPTEDRAFT_224875 [Capitella teleta]|uniref:Uncharacterized protein n=1 Tax=Capitella teleta TaxID=283909 RepID=R7VFE4_CAPTE|nr:hypothetical protein CAPTEDRAFT_224875 [Capitella teleta]|eukprot:ELU14395.1 hypothetical protein CAPTEDRAFT_224875 [Capitella teleta]
MATDSADYDLLMSPLLADQVKASNEEFPSDLRFEHQRLQVDQVSSKRVLRHVSEELHFMQALASNDLHLPPLNEDDPLFEEYRQLNDKVTELRTMSDEICDRVEEKRNMLMEKVEIYQELRQENVKDSEEYLHEFESRKQSVKQNPSLEIQEDHVIQALLAEKALLEKSLAKLPCTNKQTDLLSSDSMRREPQIRAQFNDLKTSFLGYREVSHDAYSVILECTDETVKTSNLLVTLFFQGSPFKSPLQDVSVNIPTLPIRDITKRALARYDVESLLLELRDCWTKHSSLMEEMHQLRQRYAIDWQNDEEQLVVLLGKSVHVKCILSVPKEYPHNASISLISVSSLPDIELLKPKNVNPTLTDWLEYLEEVTAYLD